MNHGTSSKSFQNMRTSVWVSYSSIHQGMLGRWYTTVLRALGSSYKWSRELPDPCRSSPWAEMRTNRMKPVTEMAGHHRALRRGPQLGPWFWFSASHLPDCAERFQGGSPRLCLRRTKSWLSVQIWPTPPLLEPNQQSHHSRPLPVLRMPCVWGGRPLGRWGDWDPWWTGAGSVA